MRKIESKMVVVECDILIIGPYHLRFNQINAISISWKLIKYFCQPPGGATSINEF